MNDSTKPHCGNYQAEKQQVANGKGKQLVLVSNLVLIALQFGPYCKPKQVVLLESRFRLGSTEPWFGQHGTLFWQYGTLFWAAGNKLWATGNKLGSM
ncbi:MAG: hypothetical protein IJ844_01125 [Prevotella sp.]|nr:hypothetical protein [Prevotella sp.]